MDGGVNKGRALRNICQIHGIPLNMSAAMGDGWNDLEMLEAAGTAWVIQSAPAELKARFPADRIALSAESDGAAIVMENML